MCSLHPCEYRTTPLDSTTITLNLGFWRCGLVYWGVQIPIWLAQDGDGDCEWVSVPGDRGPVCCCRLRPPVAETD